MWAARGVIELGNLMVKRNDHVYRFIVLRQPDVTNCATSDDSTNCATSDDSTNCATSDDSTNCLHGVFTTFLYI
jgi:hypothetical protein